MKTCIFTEPLKEVTNRSKAIHALLNDRTKTESDVVILVKKYFKESNVTIKDVHNHKHQKCDCSNFVQPVRTAPVTLPLKLITIDIENSPNEGYYWDAKTEYLGEMFMTERSRVLCFAAKWYGEDKVMFYSEFHNGRQEMLTALHRLLNEADVINSYNGIRFDIPKINAEFLAEGLMPTSPYKHIDLLRVVKGNFKLPYNTLNYVAKFLGLGSKVAHQGFTLWTACLAGDKKAWDTMRKYNKGDVVLTEKVYDALRPWIKGHPHIGLWNNQEHSCSNCGSINIVNTGSYKATTRSYVAYACNDCGKQLRSNEVLGRVSIVAV